MLYKGEAMHFLRNRLCKIISIFIISCFIQSCASLSNVYEGPPRSSNTISLIKVIDKKTSISSVDGKVTTSFGSYAFKGKFEQELTLQPGKHEIILVYGKRKTVSSKAIYEIDAKQGHTYIVKSKTNYSQVESKKNHESTSLWIEEEVSGKKIGKVLASFNEPIVDTSKRLSSSHVFSFLPPQENGWIIRSQKYDKLHLFKQGSKDDETFVILAWSGQLPNFEREEDFINAVKAKFDRIPKQKRIKIIKSDFLPGDNSDFCFLIYEIMEDHSAYKYTTDRKDYMMLETFRRLCRHPTNKNIAISIEYSHRYYPGDNDPDFMSKAEMIFNNLEYK